MHTQLINRIQNKILHLEESNHVCPEYNLIINLLKDCMTALENKKTIVLDDFMVEYIESMIKTIKFNREDLESQPMFYSVHRQEEFVMLFTDIEKLLNSIITKVK